MKSGERVGVYEILEPLGAGGMGEVWRARDTRLERQVAVKSLPAAFAADPDRLARFEREARTLAALNHPNIAQVFGLERGDEAVIVMELVDGEDLAQRIERGAVPLEEALPIARQIAEALAAAHEAGIVHRDLKPANVRVRADGTVKVLDFGLAKADGAGASAVSGATQSPTLLSPAVTQAGVILGTAAYMSPEQAKGRAVDRRADVWAFGCVLLELLSGRRAFDGSDVTEVLAAVIKDAPPFDALPADTPASIRRLLRRCLQKDASARLDSMRAARLEIDDAASDAPATDATAAVAGPWRGRALGLTAALAIALAAVVFLTTRAPVEPEAPLRYFDIELPGRGSFDSLSISPDGLTLASSAGGLRVRALGEPAWREIVSGGDVGPIAWSPDGKRFAYQAGDDLRIGDLVGTPPRTVCTGCAPGRSLRGMSWNGGDTIVLSDVGREASGILAIDVESGEAREVTRRDTGLGENSHRFPLFLPDGRRFLYVSRSDTGDHAVFLASLDGAERTSLVAAFSEIAYAAGHLLFVREGTLYAQRLDIDSASMHGDPVLIASEVGYFAGTGNAEFTVAGDGTLLYAREQAGAAPAWFDRQGQLVGDVPLPWDRFAVTPQSGIRVYDGTQYVTTLLDPALGSTDVYAYDERTGAQTRVTADPRWDQSPTWSHDGKAVLYRSNRADRPGIYLHPLDGSPERFITDVDNAGGNSIVPSPDGREVLVVGEAGIMKVALDASDSAALWQPDAEGPAFAPDGRWVAYVSAISGMPQVYLRPLVGEQRQRVATPCPAGHPRWSTGGDELFFLCGDSLYAAAIAADRQAGTPQPLFALPGNWWFGGFDVDAQGRFLGWRGYDRASTATVVLNWPRLLERKP